MIEIRYTRPPHRMTVFRQQLVHRAADCIVTLLERTSIARPMIIDDVTVLERDAPVVWFTFPGEWYDVGRFHTRAGVFTGYYANVLTPVRFVADDVWETTDLFLDVWHTSAGIVLLDEAELDAAVAASALSAELAGRARHEAGSLLDAAAARVWPPEICRSWTLERARSHIETRRREDRLESRGTRDARTV